MLLAEIQCSLVNDLYSGALEWRTLRRERMRPGVTSVMSPLRLRKSAGLKRKSRQNATEAFSVNVYESNLHLNA